VYFASVDVSESGTPTAMAEAELDYGGSEENELRPRWSHHVSPERSLHQDPTPPTTFLKLVAFSVSSEYTETAFHEHAADPARK
jgi:hypothetical protein